MSIHNILTHPGEWLRGEGPHHQIVVSSRVRLARNLKGFSFPGWAKKSERLQDVPIPVTEVNANTLVENNQVRIEDFYTQFPGLNIEVTQQSELQLSVRGLSGAVTIDDVPISVTAFSSQRDTISIAHADRTQVADALKHATITGSGAHTTTMFGLDNTKITIVGDRVLASDIKTHNG